MAVVDQDLFSAVQRKLLEPADGGASFASNLWTHAELVQAAQDRQDQLLKLTHLQVGMAEILEVADQGVYALPDDWIATVTIERFPPSGASYSLDPGDTFQADLEQPSWPAASGRPLLWADGEGEQRRVRIIPAPATAGVLLLYYIPRSALLTGYGELLTVPDELGLPGVQWGILADLLGKVGRGQDPARAAYARTRWLLVIEATRTLLKGLA